MIVGFFVLAAFASFLLGAIAITALKATQLDEIIKQQKELLGSATMLNLFLTSIQEKAVNLDVRVNKLISEIEQKEKENSTNSSSTQA